MTTGQARRDLELTADLVIEADAVLGEGPVWDAADGTLLWIDILADRVHRSDLGTGATTTIAADRTVGAVAPRAAGGLIAAVPGGFGSLRPDGTVDLLARLEADRPANRMNDGKIAPDGSFWAGTMDRSAEPGAGSLYRLAPDLSVSVVLTGLTVSNGLGWSPDGARCYFVDTAEQGIDVVRADDSGAWSRTPFVRVDRALGVPDGLTVDAAGNVWVAMCFGGRVLGYAPDGSLIATVTVPAELTTSVAFGGAGLDLLLITTGRTGLTEDQLRRQPHAGSVFAARPGVVGQASPPFAG
ncbi:MAG TPA: SMP-30/gluconolactonase/LRE family protein [Trebonia sp.]|jgi:sugar lactone lactonase YvrE|nr:SMP-30/gluconolactonase/LRE family protein [Trebonia sp.]